LLKDFLKDGARLQLDISRRNRDIADTRLRESLVRTTANVKAGYWNLVSARATVEARRTAVQLAEELARVNTAKVNVGQSPPLDLLAAQAEVASNQEQLIIAETAARQAEDQLRLLIVDPADPDAWTLTITPTDEPPVAMPAVDLDGAIAAALRDRADLVRARKDAENAAANVAYASSQRLPDVRLSGSYQANGLGGTQVLRTGGFPGTVVGPGDVTSFGAILNQVFRRDFPTWTFGVNVSYPLGQSAEDASHARTLLERAQAQQRIKSAEAKAIQQIRDAAWRIEMNARRIETARAARALAERRAEVERQRFDVGMSTSFLVIQAQRDLSQARTNELAAVLAYDLALVNFEAIQQAPPAGQGGGGTTTAAATTTPVAATPRAGGAATGSTSGIPGF
jgi:outer membrane protein TolC